MPKDFMDCVKNKGKVVTRNLKENKYIKICYDKEGNSYSGVVKIRRKKPVTNKSKSGKSYIKTAKVQLADLLRLKDHFDKNNCN